MIVLLGCVAAFFWWWAHYEAGAGDAPADDTRRAGRRARARKPPIPEASDPEAPGSSRPVLGPAQACCERRVEVGDEVGESPRGRRSGGCHRDRSPRGPAPSRRAPRGSCWPGARSASARVRADRERQAVGRVGHVVDAEPLRPLACVGRGALQHEVDQRARREPARGVRICRSASCAWGKEGRPG